MNVKTLTEQILEKISSKKSWKYKFILQLMPLMLSIRGRYNFFNLARWGDYSESAYRKNFERPFNWLAFNTELVNQSLSEDLVIAFDPSFLPKSGKHTPGLGYFYSGCSGRELRGLEMCGLAAIDQTDKSALHLEAIQTVDLQDSEGLMDFYIRSIVERKEALQTVSRVLAVDAWFAKSRFIESMVDAGFEVVTRLRKDAHLRYLYIGPRRKGRGRPKAFDGRIDVRNLRSDQVRLCAQATDGSWKAFELVANVKAWKTNARIVIVQEFKKDNSLKRVRILAATQINMDGGSLLLAYHSRFQIELLYRDAKQFTGLTHCQARSKQKIHFHLNASLTSVSLAKAAHHLNDPFKENKPFSMANVKNQYANELLLERFISTFGINPKLSKIKLIRDKIRSLGKIAA
jgi:hypothetical protein